MEHLAADIQFLTMDRKVREDLDVVRFSNGDRHIVVHIVHCYFRALLNT
jgi:hypothetical protein